MWLQRVTYDKVKTIKISLVIMIFFWLILIKKVYYHFVNYFSSVSALSTFLVPKISSKMGSQKNTLKITNLS